MASIILPSIIFGASFYEPLLVDVVRLLGLESQVEWIHREQSLMREALVLAECKGQGGVQNEANDWEEKAGKLFSEVVDLIDNFVHWSVRKSRRGTLTSLVYIPEDLVVRLDFSKKLQEKKEEILSLSKMWIKQQGEMVVVPNSGFADHTSAVAATLTAVTSAAAQATLVLEQKNLLLPREMKEPLKYLRDQFMNLCGALNDKPVEQLDERSKAWIDQAKDLAEEMTGLILKTFMDENGEQLERHTVFKIPFFLGGALESTSVYLPLKYYGFTRHVEQINVKLGCLYERKATYGIGGFGQRLVPTFKVGISNHPTQRILSFFLRFVVLDMILAFPPAAVYEILITRIHRSLDGHLKPFSDSLQSIRIDWKLMDALDKDVRRHEDIVMDNRLKAWVDEIKDISCQAKDIDNAAEQHEKRVFRQFRYASRIKIWNQIRHINDRIQDVSSRKLTYDVQIIGKKESHEQPPSCSSSAQNLDTEISEEALQESSPTRISSSGLEQILQLLRKHPVDRTGKQVEFIIWELKLMNAFLDDVKSIDQQLDARVKVWIEQMKRVSLDAKKLLDAYESKVLNMKGPFKRFLARNKFPKKIDRIKNDFHELLRMKRTYAIGGIGRSSGGHTYTLESRQEMEISNSATTKTQRVFSHFMEKIERLFMVNFAIINGTDSSIPDLAETAELIKRECRLMHALFKDVGENGRLAGLHKVWVEEMYKLDREAKAALDEYPEKQQRWWDIKGRLNLNLKMISILSKLQEISERRIAYGLEHVHRTAVLATTSTTSHQTPRPSVIIEEPGIIGFQDDLQAIVEQLLLDTEPYLVISIVGMEGIGKTTLARLICSNSAAVDQFSCCKMVSAEEDIGKLLSSLQPSQKEMALIVVDDVKTTEDWHKLSSELLSKLNRCRIVLTTRDIDVAKNVDRKRAPFKLRLLNDDSSWALFTYKLTLPESFQVLECCREHVTKCGGLPKAIIQLREKVSCIKPTPESWLQQLGDPKIFCASNQEPWKETVNVIDNGELPLYLFRCVFYLRRFPAGFEFPMRRLIALWIAEGLVRQLGNDEDSPESVAKRYMEELMDQNIIQVARKKLNGEVKHCRLPYPLKELWMLKSVKSKSITCLVHHEPSDARFSHIHGAITNVSSVEVSAYKDVSSFVSFNTRQESREELRGILKKCISNRCFLSLHVLDLEQVFRPKLPKALGKLVRLRYLGLRHTYLERFPTFISNLLNLQTLDLKRTSISTLHVSIWKMHQLRHLYLNESYRTRIPAPPSRKYSLTELHTLWGVFIDEDSPVKDGLDKLRNLKRLGLTSKLMSSKRSAVLTIQLKTVVDWIEKLKQLQCLRLKSFNHEGRASDLPLKSLFLHKGLSSLYLVGNITTEFVTSGLSCQSLIDLTLSGSELDMELIEALKDLPKLKILRLLGDSYNGTAILCSAGGFPQLQVLHLWNLRNLEKWEVEKGALPILRELEIRSCTSMKVLPSGMLYLRTLQKLMLSNMCEELTNRVKDKKGQDWHIVLHVRYVYIDSNLISKSEIDRSSISHISHKIDERLKGKGWVNRDQILEEMPTYSHHKVLLKGLSPSFLSRVASSASITRFPIGSAECPFCGAMPESAEHLFFLCKVAKMIWYSRWGFRTDDFSHLSIFEWSTYIMKLSLIFGVAPPSELNFLLFSDILMENIWLWRDRAICGEKFEMDSIYQDTLSAFNQRALSQRCGGTKQKSIS